MQITQLTAQNIDQILYAPIAIIYKHSNMCTNSNSVLNQIINWKYPFPVYQVTVQLDRELSNNITNKYNIAHATPQLIIFKNGSIRGVLSNYQACINEQLFLSYLQ